MHDFVYMLERLLIFISAPFLEIVNISITAGWAVLAVVAVRLIFKKAPKWLTCALWGIVALRLALPVSIESIFSLIPSTQTVNPSAIYNGSFELNTGFPSIDYNVNAVYGGADVDAGTGVEIAGIAALIWIIGAVAMAAYAFISFMRLKLSLRTATKKEGNIYQSESVSSPFVLGIFRPKIYLPYRMNEADIPLVIAHERAHIKRLDHVIKPLGFLLLSVHWFNPLMWAAYILLCRDIEAACDEKVINELGEDCRRSYSTALLNASISRKSIAACPLAFGEVGVKARIKGVMNYKKPAFWVVIAAVAVCVITAVCFLTNPMGSGKTDYTPKISDELDHTISLNVIEHNQGKYLDGMMSFEAHKVLATTSSTDDNSNEMITVYVVALYEEYSLENGKLTEKGGSITPLALSFLVEKDISTGKDTYALTEYWEPGMGSQYIKDLQEKFPIGVDYDTQTYVKELEKECIAQAAEYFGLSENDITEKHSVELTTVMLEAKSEYELTVTTAKDMPAIRLDNEEFFENNGYHVYSYFVDTYTAYITIGRNNILIEEALISGRMSVDKLLQKAENDAKHGKAKMEMLKDGGTKFYWYDNYTIIKRNTTDGNKDLIISSQAITLGDDYDNLFNYSNCIDSINWLNNKANADSTTATPQTKKLIINGKAYEASEYLEFNTEHGYATVPLFIVTEALGAKVSNKNADKVTIEYNANTYVLDKGKKSLKNEKSGHNYLMTLPGSQYGAVYKKSGDDYVIDSGTLNYFLLSQFGARVSCDTKSQTVTVNTDIEISLEAENKLRGKVKSANDNTIYMELTSDQSGITAGTPVTVRLSSMPFYAPEIDTSKLKRGDIVTVIYDGRVMETYPLQIDALAVYKIVE